MTSCIYAWKTSGQTLSVLAKNKKHTTWYNIKKIFSILLTFTACGSDNGTTPPTPSADDYTLLWGKWNFEYATNTMTGTRSYTFKADGKYLKSYT